MTIADIERRLRLPAPDEPAHLPPLALPSGSPLGARTVAGRVRVGPAVPALGFGSPRLAMALLVLLLALAVAVATGALRLDRLLAPQNPLGEYLGRGIALSYPADWRRLTPDDPNRQSGASTALILTNNATTGCDASEIPAANQPYPSGEPTPPPDDVLGREDRLLACLVDKPMAPGEVRVVVSEGAPQLVGVGFIEPIDYADWFGADAEPGLFLFYVPREADGWTEKLDGMPAKRLVAADSFVPGADETVTWAVYAPDRLDSPWFIRATLRGPGLDALRAQVDAIARSIHFDVRPVDLAGREPGEALAAAIDHVDREARRWTGTDFYGCFPREVGERTVELDHGPSGPLLGRVAVTCRTSVEATALNVWRAELVATWPATGGVDAGQWGMDLYLASDGGLSGQAMHPANQTTVFPGTIGELPPPLSGRLELPIGSIVAVLPPGIDQSLPPIQALYQRPDDRVDVGQIVYEAPAGTRLTVVHGPVEHEGIDWYVVDWSHGTEYPSVLGWIPATSGGRPLLEIVDPRCPADAGVTVSQLLRVIPSERVACFGGREIALEVVLATVPPLEAGAPIDGTPDWLAPDTSWRLWGPAGPEGVEGSLPIAAHPSLPGGATASEGIVRVRGHFDDAAAATCERRFPAGWVSIPELPATQVMRCRQLFVVTAIEAPAP